MLDCPLYLGVGGFDRLCVAVSARLLELAFCALVAGFVRVGVAWETLVSRDVVYDGAVLSDGLVAVVLEVGADASVCERVEQFVAVCDDVAGLLTGRAAMRSRAFWQAAASASMVVRRRSMSNTVRCSS